MLCFNIQTDSNIFSGWPIDPAPVAIPDPEIPQDSSPWPNASGEIVETPGDLPQDRLQTERDP